MLSESERALRHLSEAAADVETISGAGESADGQVTATVDHAGRLLRVGLDPRAMRMDSGTLAESVTQAVQAAQDDATRRCRELLDRALGENAPAPFDLDALRDHLDSVQDAFTRSLDDHTDAWQARRRSDHRRVGNAP
ncbi:YbaB/EbfC family nucleoid-associated protein [Nonomuraea sp. NPDC003754]